MRNHDTHDSLVDFSVVQVDADFFADLELTVIRLLLGWHARKSTIVLQYAIETFSLSPNPARSRQRAQAKKLVDTMSKSLIADLHKARYKAERLSANDPPPSRRRTGCRCLH